MAIILIQQRTNASLVVTDLIPQLEQHPMTNAKVSLISLDKPSNFPKLVVQFLT